MNSAAEAAALNEAIADEAPEMPDAITGRVKLLRGLYDADTDTWHDEAFVRELTGADEEYMADVGARDGITYSQYMSEVLKRGVLTIGELDVQKLPALIDKLILPDRDMLFLGVTKRTYGKTKDFTVVCRKCGESNDIEIDLDDDFIAIAPDFDIRKPLSVETSHGEILLKLPTGESAALAADASSDAEINTYMLATSVVDDSLTTLDERMGWARSLGLGDRRKLISALSEVQIGPKMGEVETQCASCEQDLTIAMDWVSLLLA